MPEAQIGTRGRGCPMRWSAWVTITIAGARARRFRCRRVWSRRCRPTAKLARSHGEEPHRRPSQAPRPPRRHRCRLDDAEIYGRGLDRKKNPLTCGDGPGWTPWAGRVVRLSRHRVSLPPRGQCSKTGHSSRVAKKSNAAARRARWPPAPPYQRAKRRQAPAHIR